LRETKVLKLDIKSLSEAGEFEGEASTYGNIDLGGDIVEPGSMKDSISESNGRVFLLADHDVRQRVGVAYISDGAKSLSVKGVINMAKDRATELYNEMKFYLEHGLQLGLSIGYDVLDHKWEKGIRHLKKLKLWEVSVVTFPMNPYAVVRNTKAWEGKDMELKVAGFMENLQQIQVERELYKMRWDVEDAMYKTINAIVQSEELDYSAKVQAMSQTFDDYKSVMMAIFSKILSFTKSDVGADEKKVLIIGRGSQLAGDAQKALVRQAIVSLQTLLDEKDLEEPDTSKGLESFIDGIQNMVTESKSLIEGGE
jgi:HK97 family phage prohead protease